MNTRILAVSAIVVTCLGSAVGCRRDLRSQAYLDAAGAEMLELEDRLYELQFDYEDAVAELEACRAELARLRGDSALPREPSPRVTEPPAVDSPLPPVIDPGEPVPDGDDRPAAEQPPADQPGQPEPLPALDTISHIHLNPLYTGGIDLDEAAGDDGISLAIEPRNDRHQLVPAAGDLTVVLLDPARSGAAARFARWDIDEAEVALALHKAAPGRGIRLELPWPADPPREARLQLFVRFTTVDGRQLEARRDIDVRLPGQRSVGWTPRVRR